MKKAPIISVLKNAGFTPYMFPDNKEEFTLTLADGDGDIIYVSFKNPCITLTSQDGVRKVTTYFNPADTLSFLLELGYVLNY